jgi:hypothetical protein
MIALPLLAGGLNATAISVLPATTVGVAGASGTVDGTTAGLDGSDAALVPSMLDAVTVQV